MKVSADTSLGIPPGGAIILGRLDGIPLDVGLGTAFEVGSWIMLVGMTKLEAPSVPILLCDWTGVGFGEGVTGMGMVAESMEGTLLEAAEMTGVADAVALPDVDAGASEAGMLAEELPGCVGVGETPLPTEPDGTALALGVIPEGSTDAEGVTLGVIPLRVSLGIGAEGLMLAEGVGTAPDPEPDGRTPEVMLDKMPETMLLAGGRETGAEADGKGVSEIRLDTMLGTTDEGKSETAEESKLETSETNEDTRGGSTPDGVGVGDGVVGAVGPAEPEGGRTPETSDTKEDRIDGRSSRPELADAASEVGIAPELARVMEGVGVAPVPNAVVIPTTIPPEDGWTDTTGSLLGETTPLVGETMLLGRTPVEPTCCGLGVGSGSLTSEDRRPPTKP